MARIISQNNSVQLGQNFQNELPDNLSGIKNKLSTKLGGSQKSYFCPSWAEVKNQVHHQLLTQKFAKVKKFFEKFSNSHIFF